MATNASMTIGQLARAGGVGVETVRYYQRLKLLDSPPRSYGSVRRYGPDSLERVRSIKRAQRLGFTLAEIKVLYLLDAKRGRHQAHALAARKIVELDRRLADMRAMRSALAELIAACEKGEENLPCPIVVAFAGPLRA
ncbi:MAG TPA: MerR family transcriptional regulator [Burkholderiales bacterium]|nr:MerR family transcriptional regulator [Burkholderiales bacterium]